MPDDKPAEKKAKAEPKEPLALPDLHYLQAQRQTLQMNRDALAQTPEQSDAIKDLDKQIAEIDKQIAAG